MAYDSPTLESDVRMKLGDISESSLPDNIIEYWGKHYDEDSRYTSKYPYIYYYTTLECVNYLKLQSITSGSAAASKVTEKVGDVSRTVENSSSSGSSALDIWDDLLDSLKADKAGFGIVVEGNTGSVIINGTDTDTVEEIRNNVNLSSIFNTGTVASRRNPAFAFHNDHTHRNIY